MSRVLIVNMPFSNLRWPNLGPSLLKAALTRRGIGSDLAYFNFDFAERVGIDNYCWIADYFAFVLGGERLFAKHYFPDQLPDDDSYYRNVLLPADRGFTDQDWADYRSLEQHVEPFLDDCANWADWAGYAVVGFAASFQQTMSSICLARRIKQINPDVKIVFGGAACEGEMGIELGRRFPLLDYVFPGEADLTFPPLVEAILDGKEPHPAPGVIGRETCGAAPDPARFMTRDLDALPYPDFDDYFARAKRSPLKDDVSSLLFFETSRGCWWGEKHHCKFCGLNGGALSYRAKSPERAVDELEYLVKRHGIHQACSADNILDWRYFDTFLPILKRASIDLAFVYEMKTNLTRRQVETLLEAGLGAAQLGIETFITPLLKMIGKGANALQNLQALKWFSESGIEVKWNLLYGFPGENPHDYAGLAELLPSLVHLAPPLAAGRVRMDRFAPYFEDPACHGMINARPHRAFEYVYPFADESLRRLAYYYEYDYADGRNPTDYAAEVLAAVDRWQELKGTVTLRQWDRPDGILIVTDTRPVAATFQRRLTGLARELYLYCDSGRSLRRILDFATRRTEDAPVAEAAVKRILEEWIEERIMAQMDGRYLSLALRAASE